MIFSKDPQKILIIKPSSLGDIVHSLPFLHVLHNRFPDAKIDWIVARGNEGLLEGNQIINKLLIIDKDNWKNAGKIKDTLAEMGRLVKTLRNEGYDLVIDLQGLLRSGLMAAATGSSMRMGFSEAREGSALFYTHKVGGGRELHAVDRYLKVAHALGCDTRNIIFPMPVISESSEIKRLKKKLGEYAVIVPGARWHTKRWLAESFGAVAAMLKVKSIIVGSELDRTVARKIAERSKGMAVAMAGETSIPELISLIRGAKYVVTNDSGPMHIAAAYEVPAVAIFGPTNPAMTGPYGHNHIIVTAGNECAPCYKKKCEDLKCMKEISVEQVHKAIMSIIPGSKKSSAVTRKTAASKQTPGPAIREATGRGQDLAVGRKKKEQKKQRPKTVTKNKATKPVERKKKTAAATKQKLNATKNPKAKIVS